MDKNLKTVEEIKEWITNVITPKNKLEALYSFGLIGIILYVVDKGLKITENHKDMFSKINSHISDNSMFETIDSIGDQIQFVDSIMQGFGLKLTGQQTKDLADLLQNIGTLGKNINKFVDAIKGKWNK